MNYWYLLSRHRGSTIGKYDVLNPRLSITTGTCVHRRLENQAMHQNVQHGMDIGGHKKEDEKSSHHHTGIAVNT